MIRLAALVFFGAVFLAGRTGFGAELPAPESPFPDRYDAPAAVFQSVTKLMRLYLRDLREAVPLEETQNETVYDLRKAPGVCAGDFLRIHTESFVDEGGYLVEKLTTVCGARNGLITIRRKKNSQTPTPPEKLLKFELPEPAGHSEYTMIADWDDFALEYSESADLKKVVLNSRKLYSALLEIREEKKDDLYVRTYQMIYRYFGYNGILAIVSRELDSGYFFRQFQVKQDGVYVDRKTFDRYYGNVTGGYSAFFGLSTPGPFPGYTFKPEPSIFSLD